MVPVIPKPEPPPSNASSMDPAAALFQHIGSVPGMGYPAAASKPVADKVPVVHVQAAVPVAEQKSPPLEVDPSPTPPSAARIKELLRAFSSPK